MDKQYKKTALGTVRKVSSKQILGYCQYACHKGIITHDIMAEKKCLEKGCYHFRQNLKNPYWEYSARKKAEAKEKKKMERRKEKDKEQRLQEMLALVQEMSERNAKNIVVLNIREKEDGLAVHYISPVPKDDSKRYETFAALLEKKMQKPITLVHVKDLNGQYATITSA